MAYVLIDWHEPRKVFLLRPAAGLGTWHETAEDAISAALSLDGKIRVNEKMEMGKLIELTAAAIFKGVTLHDLHGKAITGTPVPDAKVSYITRDQLGAILPDGWYIECQLNRYAACCGEMVTLPARGSLAAAISDIHEFLTLSIEQANNDLKASVRAQRVRAETEQQSFWLSSDSPQGAADASAELDNIA